MHGKKQFQCSLCSKKFSRHDDLQRHERTLHRKDGFLCNICNTKLLDKVAFQGHIKAAHSLKCSKCQKTFCNQAISIDTKRLAADVQSVVNRFNSLLELANLSCEPPPKKARLYSALHSALELKRRLSLYYLITQSGVPKPGGMGGYIYPNNLAVSPQ